MPPSPLAKSVEFTDDEMQVFLRDGRTVRVPLLWFARLASATPEQVLIDGGGIGLHWEEIDEDLSVAGQTGGADWRSA